LLRKAADQGNTLAQSDLGVMCANGEGLKQDWVQAYKWFSLAGMGGSEEIIKIMKSLEEKMTPDEIEAAKMLAREWVEKHK
jgi:hypothetical protein